MQRRVILEGVDNFRDFGGYPTRHGRPLKQGRLYRSASHAAATDADLEAIAALGIGVVVDLRRKPERERAPSRRHPEFDAVVIANDAEQPDSWQEHIRTSDLTPESFRRYLVTYYREAPFEPRHVDLFRRYFQTLAETDRPVLIHCAAGKDRTGVLAALTHHIAGVDPEDILADYLLTNNPQRFAARLPMVAAVVKEISGRDADEASLMIAMGVEAEYLAAAFQAIDEACGDVDTYLDTVIGLTPALRARIADRLLE
ncbi:MAG: tyrosine-protein phosphatase [Caulobacteraceae bacterium]|nr:tyrosine-protein phosphatase [Caulobacteraceae bacterium]